MAAVSYTHLREATRATAKAATRATDLKVRVDVYKRQGLITGILGFNETGTALMLTIFALQDSFGTACNVTGDGALTMILTGFAEKHGIKRQKIESGL